MLHVLGVLGSSWPHVLVRITVRLTAIVLTAVFVSSCGGDSLQVVAEFSNTQDIEVGKKVLHDGQQIGEVVDIDPNSYGSKVTLALNPEAAAKLSGNSAAVVNRLKEGAPLEIYNRNSVGGSVLVDGQSIRGLDSMLQLGSWMVGDAIQLGSSTLSEYIESFQGYLNSERFQDDKAAVKEQFDNAKNQANDVLKELQSDIESASDELLATEQAAAQAIEELGRELAPVVEELSGDGARLAEELNKFAESIENSSVEEQQAGEAFLASLLTTLERLNQALEDGAKEGVKEKTEHPND